MTASVTSYEPDCTGQRIEALRDRIGETDVTALEVFFDLVWVFAVSQVSRKLADDLSWTGGLKATIMMIAVWWAWIDTAWVTNWFDPRRLPIRLMLIAMMAVGLVMAAGIPQAFSGRAAWFAIGYVGIQLGRSLFCLFLLGDNVLRRNFMRISFWAALSAPLWIGGIFVEGDQRIALWVAAALLDCGAPALGFITPWIGRSTAGDWSIAGGHLAERCQLFVVIALGESVVRTGNSLIENQHIELLAVLTFLTAFAMNVLLWWVYFARAGRATDVFAGSENPGGMGRAYTYFHLPMIYGIVVLAVGDNIAIVDPRGVVSSAFVGVIVGGALLYLFGNAIFNSTITAAFPWRRLTVAIAILLCLPLAGSLTPLTLMLWVVVPFVVLAVVDTVTLHPPEGEFEIE